MVRPIDTSIEARGRQVEAYRAMHPSERLRLADEMTAEVRELARSGIRARLGTDASDAAIESELARILHGADVAAALGGRSPAGRR